MSSVSETRASSPAGVFPDEPGGTASPMLKLPPVGRLLAAAAQANVFEPGRPVHVARAPGRLDVMGGIADYSGAAVCELPLAIAAAAAVQLRYDGQAVCRSAQTQREVRLPMERLLDADPLAVRRMCEEADAWARYPLGCAWWLLRRQVETHDPAVGQLRHGVTIALDSDVPLGGGVSSSAAIEVASMTAMLSVLGAKLPPMTLAAACQAVENRVVGAACGIMDQAAAVLGRADALLVLLCQPDDARQPAQVVETELRVPAGYAFVGIHSGVAREVKGASYTDTRVAAFMAQKILSRVNAEEDLTRGHLANVDPERFVDTWQAQLPTTMTGAAFIEDYQATDDEVTQVSPTKVYHVRAAATHHVLEAERVRQFVELLRQAGGETPLPARDRPTAPTQACAPAKAGGFAATLRRWLAGSDAAGSSAKRAVTRDVDALMTQAGELMYASHESYGECARLGHAMTDRLVAMARAIGPAGGVYGAKITGGGAGGTVALLVRDRDDVHAKVNELRQQYTRETNHTTLLFRGSGPGAMAVGTARV